MDSLFLWWLAQLVVGISAFPIAYVLLGRFPDRGYVFSKVLGLLLLGYFSWVFGHLTFGTGTVIFSAFLTVLLSGILIWSWVKRPCFDFVKTNLALFMVLECLFFLAFLVAGAYKMRTFGIVGTEKPMDFAFLNGILASVKVPPNDPWLAGGSISYYYFGYFIVACLAKLTGVSGGVAYNLAVALVWALAFTCTFSLVYALTRRYRYSILSAFALAVFGNLDYWHRAVQSFQVGNLRIPYYNDAGIGAQPGGLSGAWNFLLSPLRSGWDYFQASRIIPVPPSDKMINEFPSFSFFLSDLHPHLMAIPFVLLAMGLCFNLLTSPLPGWRLFGGGLGWRVLQGAFWGLALGGLSFLNSWDFPTFTLLFGLCLLFQQLWTGEGGGEDRIKALLGVGAPIILMAFLFYLPFYLKLQSQAQGLGFVSVGRTGLYHFLVIFGFFLAVLVPALVGKAFAAPKVKGSKRKQEGLVCIVCGQEGPGKKFCGVCGGELSAPFDLEVQPIPWEGARSPLAGVMGWLNSNPLGGWGLLGGILLVLGILEVVPANLAVLMVALVLLGLAVLSLAAKSESKEMVFATLLVLVAFLLVASCEVVYMRDLFGGALYRMNTVFKFHYQVWLLLAVASGPFLKWTLESQWPGWSPWRRWVWGSVAGFALLGASLYPVFALTAKLKGTAGEPVTLDGSVYYEKAFNTDYQAAQWLKANAQSPQGKTPVILEAWGGSYHQEFGRLATLTGFPTVLGWDWHEVQWRGSGDKKVIRGGREDDTIQRRQADIDAIYGGTDLGQARELLIKYGVQYLYLGGAERDKYRDKPEGLAKLSQLGPVVWQLGESILLKVAP